MLLAILGAQYWLVESKIFFMHNFMVLNTIDASIRLIFVALDVFNVSRETIVVLVKTCTVVIVTVLVCLFWCPLRI